MRSHRPWIAAHSLRNTRTQTIKGSADVHRLDRHEAARAFQYPQHRTEAAPRTSVGIAPGDTSSDTPIPLPTARRMATTAARVAKSSGSGRLCAPGRPSKPIRGETAFSGLSGWGPSLDTLGRLYSYRRRIRCSFVHSLDISQTQRLAGCKVL